MVLEQLWLWQRDGGGGSYYGGREGKYGRSGLFSKYYVSGLSVVDGGSDNSGSNAYFILDLEKFALAINPNRRYFGRIIIYKINAKYYLPVLMWKLIFRLGRVTFLKDGM